MILEDKNLIFLHIPKTGGTSIMKALRPYGLKGSGHMQLSRELHVHKVDAAKRPDYLVFCVSRNPWDLVVSNYSYIKMEKSYWHSLDGSTNYGKHPDYEFVKKLSFREFVYALKDKKIKSKYNTLPQSYWANRPVDKVLRFEKLNEDFKVLCKEVGLGEIELPHLNKSPHKSYKDFYNNELIEVVGELYQKDIEKFSYRF